MRCLIVDDSPRFLEAAGGLLVREGIVIVAVATNGADAIRRAAELGPDVILVDIDLGGQSGFDVARRMTTSEADLAPPAVILISTHAEEDYAELIGASPAAGFLPKTKCLLAPSVTFSGSRRDGYWSGQRASRKVTTASTRR